MKVRCPYCKSIFEPSGRNQCPHCKKTVLMPGFFKGGKAGNAGRISTRASKSRQVSPLPGFFLMNRPIRIALIVAVLLIVGNMLLRQARRGPPETEPHNVELVRGNLDTLRVALSQLRSHCERYPSTEEGLVSLIHDPGMKGWNGPYVFELKPDPWGRSFKYLSDTEQAVLYSAGPDGVDGSADDIRIEVKNGSKIQP